MQSTSYHIYHSIEGNVDEENINKSIDKKENKNLKLFICFNLVMLTILITMMLLGYGNVPDSNGRQFLLVSSLIIGVFMIIIIICAILMSTTKSICASIVFFTICTFYTIVHSILAIVYIIFFFFYSEWKFVNYLVVAFFFYLFGLTLCLFNFHKK